MQGIFDAFVQSLAVALQFSLFCKREIPVLDYGSGAEWIEILDGLWRENGRALMED